MKLSKILRALTAAVMAASVCGCTVTFGTNPKIDNSHYVAKPSDSSLVSRLGVTYGEFMNDYTYYLNALGIEDDSVENLANLCKSYREEILESLILEKVCELKAEEYGVTELTETEEAQVAAAAETLINERVSYYAENADYGDTDASSLTDEEKTARGEEELDKALAEYGLTRDVYYEKQRRYMYGYKVLKAIGETLDKADAEALFDEYAELGRETYESSVSDYEQSGLSDYYIPEGSRYIKQIYLPFDTDAYTEISSARIVGDDEGADELREQSVEALSDTLDEILLKLGNGEDWDTVEEEYSEDTTSAYYPDGVLVIPNGTAYLDAFQEAAFIPENVGDMTTLTTDHGVYLLLYASVAEISDTDREIAIEYIFASQMQAAFTQKTEEWVDEYGFWDNVDYDVVKIDNPNDENDSDE